MVKRPFLKFCLLLIGFNFGFSSMKPAFAHFCELTLSNPGPLRAQELDELPHHLTAFLQYRSLIQPGDPTLLMDSTYYPADGDDLSRVATRLSHLEGRGPHRFIFDLTGNTDSFFEFFGDLRTHYLNENSGAVLRMTSPFVGALLSLALFSGSLVYGAEYVAASTTLLAASWAHLYLKHRRLERMRQHILHLTSVSAPLDREFPEWSLLGMSDRISRSDIPKHSPSTYLLPSVVKDLQSFARTSKSVGVHWDILFFKNPNAKEDGDLAQPFLTYLFVRIEP